MTVATTASRKSYNGDDATIEFVFTFKAFEASDIKVVVRSALGVETTLTLDTDYTVAVLATTGGTVTLIGTYAATPPATGETVTVYRDLPYTQEIDPVENDPQRADVAEEGLDRAVILIQQLKDAISRSIQLPVSTAVSDLSLPEPEAAKYLGWNDDGDALENRELISLVGVSSFMAGMLNDTSAKAVRETLGTAPLSFGSDADGDMYYRASGALARLAKGAANYKLFMNAGATAPEWRLGYLRLNASRALAAENGDVAYTGVGFKPSAIMVIGSIQATPNMCIGFATAASQASVWSFPGGNFYPQPFCLLSFVPTYYTDYAIGVLKTMDADGFTITWTKTGGPTGTAALYFLCIG